jgi:arsenite-transporting ATPase
MNKFVFFGGKGGVGKTTSSAAYAYHCSKEGQKTLVVSTDPAHSLCDIFQMTIGPKVKTIGENLDALEIDPALESEAYIERIKINMKETVSPVIIGEIEKQLDAASVSPGSEESAIFDKMIEIVNDYGERYDKIIFDTAPTGHTLRLLSLPELLGGWLDKLIEKREKAVKLLQIANRDVKKPVSEDPVVSILSKRKDSLEKARETLIDSAHISFVFVLNPEKMPLEETKKAVAVLEKYHIPVNDIVVNRILPDHMTDTFWQARKTLEKQYLSEIDNSFKKQRIIKIPLLDSDVSEAHIAAIAAYFDDVRH